MRLGVLDIGSNTEHLLVVDARTGFATSAVVVADDKGTPGPVRLAGEHLGNQNPDEDEVRELRKPIAMSTEEIAVRPGVSASQAPQVGPDALIAGACLDIFDLSELEICPWALHEGVIPERIDRISIRS